MAVLPGVRYGGGHLIRGLCRSGALILTVVLMSCEAGAGAQVSSAAALRDTLGIGPRVTLHRVALGGERDSERIIPTELVADEGDVVAFETVDGRIHELAFEPDSLALDALDFLRRTGQMKSPPMIDRGTRFLVDFEDAPDGRYVFHGRTVGPPVYAVIVIGVTQP
jgi:plastocyanin